MNKRFLISFSFVFLFVLTGCVKKEKTFTSPAGLKITLNTSFKEKEIVSQTFYLESKDMIFTALNEDKSLFQQVGINFETYSLTSYTQLVLSSNYLTADIETEDRLVYLTMKKKCLEINLPTVHRLLKARMHFGCVNSE